MASGGSPAARGCSIEGGRKLFLGELPLRRADGSEKGRSGFWGSPAARGCSIRDERKRLFLGELPLHGAAGLENGRSGFWWISRCAGLLD